MADIPIINDIRSLLDEHESDIHRLDKVSTIFTAFFNILSVFITLNPSFLFTPFVTLITIVGIATYPILLSNIYNYEQITKKHMIPIYLILIVVAGYYLVYFSKYVFGSFCYLVWMYTAICCIVVIAHILKHKNKSNFFILLVLLASILSPFIIIYSPDHPQLVVSPDPKFIDTEPGKECKDKVTIDSTLGNAYNITLYADCINEGKDLAVYIDGKEKGPFTCDEILKGHKQSTDVLIVTSPEIENGTYTIFLNSTYYDSANNVYRDFNFFNVTVRDKPDSTSQKIFKFIVNIFHWFLYLIKNFFQLILYYWWVIVIIIILFIIGRWWSEY